jgi:hypothetical protein
VRAIGADVKNFGAATRPLGQNVGYSNVGKKRERAIFPPAWWRANVDGPHGGTDVDRTKPYISFERAASGIVGAIHLVMPDGKRLDVKVDRKEDNAAAFDYFSDKLKDGVNL